MGSRKTLPLRANVLGQIQPSFATLGARYLLQGLAFLLSPYSTLPCCVAFASRAFILPHDLIRQWITSNQDLNSNGFSKHAVTLPVLLPLFRILLPDFTSGKKQKQNKKILFLFARLNSDVSFSENSWCSQLTSLLLWLLVLVGVWIYLHISYIAY